MSVIESLPNPSVDEVRRIRRQIVERWGNDIDRLAVELRQVEKDFQARIGIFASVSENAAENVVASWGDMSAPPSDASTEEVRRARQRLANKP